MAFPVVGTTICVVSLIPMITASIKSKNIRDLKTAKPFKYDYPGYYHYSGTLQASPAIKVNIDEGSGTYKWNLGILKYDVYRVYETLRTTDEVNHACILCTFMDIRYI